MSENTPATVPTMTVATVTGALVAVDEKAISTTAAMLATTSSFKDSPELSAIISKPLTDTDAALFVGAGRQLATTESNASVGLGKALYVLGISGTFDNAALAELVGVNSSRITQLRLIGETVARFGVPAGVTPGQLSTALSKGAGKDVRVQLKSSKPSVAKIAKAVKDEIKASNTRRRELAQSRAARPEGNKKASTGAVAEAPVTLEQETAIRHLVDACAYLSDRVADKERFTDADVATISAAMRTVSEALTARRNNKNGQ